MEKYLNTIFTEMEFDFPPELVNIVNDYNNDDLLNLLKENGLYEYYYEPEEYVKIPKEFTHDYLNNFLKKEEKEHKNVFDEFNKNFKCKNGCYKNSGINNIVIIYFGKDLDTLTLKNKCPCFTSNRPKAFIIENINKFKRICPNKIKKRFFTKNIESYNNTLNILKEIEDSFDYDFRKLKSEKIKYSKNTNQYKDKTKIEKYFKYTYDSLQELISLFGLSDYIYEDCYYRAENYYLKFIDCKDVEYYHKFVFDNLVFILNKFLIYSKQKMIDESFRHFHD
jgi:hypothetical protein